MTNYPPPPPPQRRVNVTVIAVAVVVALIFIVGVVFAAYRLTERSGDSSAESTKTVVSTATSTKANADTWYSAVCASGSRHAGEGSDVLVGASNVSYCTSGAGSPVYFGDYPNADAAGQAVRRDGAVLGPYATLSHDAVVSVALVGTRTANPAELGSLATRFGFIVHPVTDTPPPSVSVTVSTSVVPVPPPSGRITVSNADGQGFLNGPRCNAANPAMLIGRTTGSRVVVCETGVGRFYYKGQRLSDGATTELDDPVPTQGGFIATGSGSTHYTINPSSLVIDQGGKVLGSEAMVEFWRR